MRAPRLVVVAIASCGTKSVPEHNVPASTPPAHTSASTEPLAIPDAVAAPRRALTRAKLPKGPFVTFTRYDAISCGLRRDGTIACFDTVTAAPKSGFAPGGKFSSLDFGGEDGCAIRDSGRVVCFGEPSFGKRPKPPATAVRVISRAASTLCWIDTAGAIGCSSDDATKLVTAPKPDAKFQQLSCGLYACCALSVDGELRCFGAPPDLTTPPTGHFTALAAESVIAFEASALDAAGTIHSWVADRTHTMAMYAVTGPFASITLDRGRVCALRADHTGQCFSFGCAGQPEPLPGCEGNPFELDGTFQFFSYDCGVDMDGEPACLVPTK